MILPPPNLQRRSHASKASGRTGFSLVEMLVVIVIMSLMLAIGAGALLLSGHAPTLSTATLQVKGVLDQGRQIALANNKYVQVRFYQTSPSPTPAGYEAIGLFVADSPYYGDTDAADAYKDWESAGRFKPADRIFRLSDSLLLADDPSSSKFFDKLRTDAQFKRIGKSAIAGTNYDWIAFYYLPNGTTDFQTIGGGTNTFETKDAYFSLVQRNEYGVSTPDLPSNFTTFALPPATGRAVVIRP